MDFTLQFQKASSPTKSACPSFPAASPLGPSSSPSSALGEGVFSHFDFLAGGGPAAFACQDVMGGSV